MADPKLRQAMVMAAGLGTRLRPFTDILPKPFLPVMGIPMIQFVLEGLAQAGVERVVTNVHHHTSKAVQVLGDRVRGSSRLAGLKVLVSDESRELLGSAGGLKKAEPLFDPQEFFIANADILSSIKWDLLWQHHQKLKRNQDVLLTLAVFPSSPAGQKNREIIYDQKSCLVTSLGELKANSPFYVGSAVIHPKALEHLHLDQPADFVKDVLKPLISRGKVGVFPTDGVWLDLGTPTYWMQAHFQLMRLLEENRDIAPPLNIWRELLLEYNEKVRPSIWTYRSPGKAAHLNFSSKWKAPCYWCPSSKDPLDQTFPEFLGPRAVLYGNAPSSPTIPGPLENGIGLDGKWEYINKGF